MRDAFTVKQAANDLGAHRRRTRRSSANAASAISTAGRPTTNAETAPGEFASTAAHANRAKCRSSRRSGAGANAT